MTDFKIGETLLKSGHLQLRVTLDVRGHKQTEENSTRIFGFHIDLKKRTEYADSLDMQLTRTPSWRCYYRCCH